MGGLAGLLRSVLSLRKAGGVLSSSKAFLRTSRSGAAAGGAGLLGRLKRVGGLAGAGGVGGLVGGALSSGSNEPTSEASNPLEEPTPSAADTSATSNQGGEKEGAVSVSLSAATGARTVLESLNNINKNLSIVVDTMQIQQQKKAVSEEEKQGEEKDLQQLRDLAGNTTDIKNGDRSSLTTKVLKAAVALGLVNLYPIVKGIDEALGSIDDLIKNIKGPPADRNKFPQHRTLPPGGRTASDVISSAKEGRRVETPIYESPQTATEGVRRGAQEAQRQQGRPMAPAGQPAQNVERPTTTGSAGRTTRDIINKFAPAVPPSTESETSATGPKKMSFGADRVIPEGIPGAEMLGGLVKTGGRTRGQTAEPTQDAEFGSMFEGLMGAAKEYKASGKGYTGPRVESQDTTSGGDLASLASKSGQAPSPPPVPVPPPPPPPPAAAPVAKEAATSTKPVSTSKPIEGTTEGSPLKLSGGATWDPNTGFYIFKGVRFSASTQDELDGRIKSFETGEPFTSEQVDPTTGNKKTVTFNGKEMVKQTADDEEKRKKVIAERRARAAAEEAAAPAPVPPPPPQPPPTPVAAPIKEEGPTEQTKQSSAALSAGINKFTGPLLEGLKGGLLSKGSIDASAPLPIPGMGGKGGKGGPSIKLPNIVTPPAQTPDLGTIPRTYPMLGSIEQQLFFNTTSSGLSGYPM